MDAQNSKRVRINAVQDAKGFFKLDVTAEVERIDDADAIALASKTLADTIVSARLELETRGMKWLSDPEVTK